MKNNLALALIAIFGFGAITAQAAEVSVSGFGTLGYAQSNQPFDYQRFINDSGTLKRDSIAGAQVDAKFTDEISATVQATLAPSLKSDSTLDASLSWAFLSWRPTNDLLIRLGKQRSPAYLYSESMDVGETYDFARLPTEMYSLLSSTDYIGASVSNTWNTKLGDLTLDGYAGRMSSYWRFYQRDNVYIPGVASHPGANFEPFTFTGGGLVLTLQQDENKFRLGVHKVTGTTTANDWRFPAYQTQVPASALAPAPLAPFIGGSAYTVLPQDFTKEVPTINYTFGADIKLPNDFRVIGEYARRKFTAANSGIDTNAGYIALLKDVGSWTPYVSLAVLKSKPEVLSLYKHINSNQSATALAPIPVAVGTAAVINASQRVMADGMSVYDQSTIALGTSYRIAPNQKLKFEWARTHVGVASSLVDAPSGGNVSDKNIDVFSVSYNVVF